MSYHQLQVPESGKEDFTDYSRWRLLVNDGGRHTWHYLQTDEECARWPQNSVDKYWLGLPVVSRNNTIDHLYPELDTESAHPSTRQRPVVFSSQWVQLL